MASRENQGLQIALILFVMITVALGVATYVFWDKSSERYKELQEAKKRETDATNYNRSLISMVKYLKSLMGYETVAPAEVSQLAETIKQNAQLGTDFDDIKTDYDNDMAKFDDAWLTAAGGQKNYRHLASFMQHQVNTKNLQLDEFQNNVKQAQQVQDTTEAKLQGALTAAENARDDANTAKSAALTANTKLDSDYRDNAAKLQSEVTEWQDEKKAVETELSQKLKEVTASRDALVALNDGLKNQLNELRSKGRTLDQPDGRIVWVTQRAQSVWINLGVADGLHRQTTFSIFDRDESNFKNVAPKAKIEVTRMIDRHLAEARILEDKISNPIVPGDLIYTPGWSPGERVKFALAGFMDYDGDGKSDRDLVKNVIQVNDGEVVAEVTDNGDIVGSLSFDTRYLVLGEEPRGGGGDNKTLINFGKFKDEASGYGVEVIEVAKLLELMGFAKEAKTEPLTRGGVREVEGATPFRPRTPPESEAGGAFPR